MTKVSNCEHSDLMYLARIATSLSDKNVPEIEPQTRPSPTTAAASETRPFDQMSPELFADFIKNQVELALNRPSLKRAYEPASANHSAKRLKTIANARSLRDINAPILRRIIEFLGIDTRSILSLLLCCRNFLQKSVVDTDIVGDCVRAFYPYLPKSLLTLRGYSAFHLFFCMISGGSKFTLAGNRRRVQTVPQECLETEGMYLSLPPLGEPEEVDGQADPYDTDEECMPSMPHENEVIYRRYCLPCFCNDKATKTLHDIDDLEGCFFAVYMDHDGMFVVAKWKGENSQSRQVHRWDFPVEGGKSGYDVFSVADEKEDILHVICRTVDGFTHYRLDYANISCDCRPNLVERRVYSVCDEFKSVRYDIPLKGRWQKSAARIHGHWYVERVSDADVICLDLRTGHITHQQVPQRGTYKWQKLKRLSGPFMKCFGFFEDRRTKSRYYPIAHDCARF